MVFGISTVLKRQSGIPFALPDYLEDTGDIYRKFTANLLRDMNLVDVLVYAAAQHYPGQPSWVPDWAAKDRQPWGDRLQSMLTSGAGKIHHGLSDGGHFVSKIHLDEKRQFITLKAYSIATISMCASVHTSSGRFDHSQRDAYLENLRWLQLQHRIDLADRDTTQTGRRLVRWSLRKSPTEMLNLLTRLDATQQIVKDFFAIEELHGNMQRATFSAPNLVDDPFYSYHGECSLSGRVGDHIIQTQGLYPALLVRPRQEPENAVELISPVILHLNKGFLSARALRLWERESKRQSELQFEEYRIY